jgi:hypothetical protein
VIVVGVLATQLGIAATLWVAAVAVALAGIATLVAQDVRAIGVESEPAPPPETMPRSRGVAARYAASQATPT